MTTPYTSPGFLIPTQIAPSSLEQGATNVEAQIYFYSWDDLGTGTLPQNLDGINIILFSNANITTSTAVVVNQVFVNYTPLSQYSSSTYPYALVLTSPSTSVPLQAGGLNKITLVGFTNPTSATLNFAIVALYQDTVISPSSSLHFSANYVQLIPRPVHLYISEEILAKIAKIERYLCKLDKKKICH
jgi:hypothetical protein